MKLFVAVVMFVVGFSVFAVGQSPNPIPGPGKERQPVQNSGTNEDQKAGAPNTMSKDPAFLHDRQHSAAVGEPDVQDSSTYPRQPSSEGWTWRWNEMTFLTLALVFVGAMQALIYYWQSCYMQEQAGYMREGLEVTRQSAKAAETGAEAAKKSAQVSEDALKLTERAYLAIGGWQWSQPEAAHPGSISYFLVNSGRTAAEVFGSYTERCVDRRPATIDSDYRQHLIRRQGLTIAAQEMHQVHVDRNDPILPSRWQEIRGAVIQLYVFTHVEYGDVFGERYEVGCLVRYDPEARQFLVHDDTAHNYHRKKH